MDLYYLLQKEEMKKNYRYLDYWWSWCKNGIGHIMANLRKAFRFNYFSLKDKSI